MTFLTSQKLPIPSISLKLKVSCHVKIVMRSMLFCESGLVEKLLTSILCIFLVIFGAKAFVRVLITFLIVCFGQVNLSFMAVLASSGFVMVMGGSLSKR